MLKILSFIALWAMSFLGGNDLDIGDKFAFAGLESNKLVPSFAIEISEQKTNTRSEERPMKDEVIFYTGTTTKVVSPETLTAYLQQVYEAAKEAATDGHVYKSGSLGDTRIGEEILEAPTTDKSYAYFACLYKYNDKWFRLSVSHKLQDRKFVKEYPEKYIGVCVSVQEWNVDE